MGEVVCSMAMSHVALTADAPATEQIDRLRDCWRICKNTFERAEPTLVVAFLDDHFENFTLHAVPTLAICEGEEIHGPPPEYVHWLGQERRQLTTNVSSARALAGLLVQQGFEPLRTDRAELGHNFMEPLRHLGAEAAAVPVVPIFINVFAPPTMTFGRALELGHAVHAAVAELPNERVAVIGTGGLSHSPLYWNPNAPNTPFFQRMKEFQHAGIGYLSEDPTLFTELGENEIALGASGDVEIAVQWDRKFLDHLTGGDRDALSKYDTSSVSDVAGPGALEALTWVAAFGAMGLDARASYVAYEPVTEWITGVGFAIFTRGA